MKSVQELTTDWGLIVQSYTRQKEYTITRFGYFLGHLVDLYDKFHIIFYFFLQSRTTLTPIIHYTAILCTKNVGGIDTTSHILELLFHKFIIVWAKLV